MTPVPEDAPPLFITIADDDGAVAPISSARLYEQWHKAGKSVELHIFANGSHGFVISVRKDYMNTWTSEELQKIGNADELEIITLRRSGKLRKPVTIWVVRVGNDLYVRSYRGREGAWFRAAQARQEGRILAGGVGKDVSFVKETDPDINDKVDAAYHTKYHRYPQYVAPMVTAEVRSTTVKLVPRSTGI